MKSQMKSLEDEVKLLRQRLAKYEGDNNQNDRNRKSNNNKAATTNSNTHMIKEQLLLSQSQQHQFQFNTRQYLEPTVFLNLI